MAGPVRRGPPGPFAAPGRRPRARPVARPARGRGAATGRAGAAAALRRGHRRGHRRPGRPHPGRRPRAARRGRPGPGPAPAPGRLGPAVAVGRRRAVRRAVPPRPRRPRVPAPAPCRRPGPRRRCRPRTPGRPAAVEPLELTPEGHLLVPDEVQPAAADLPGDLGAAVSSTAYPAGAFLQNLVPACTEASGPGSSGLPGGDFLGARTWTHPGEASFPARSSADARVDLFAPGAATTALQVLADRARDCEQAGLGRHRRHGPRRGPARRRRLPARDGDDARASRAGPRSPSCRTRRRWSSSGSATCWSAATSPAPTRA